MAWPTDAPHLEAGALLHALHEPETVDRRVLAHLAECEPCRAAQRQLADADAEVAAMLPLLDHPQPSPALDELIRRRPRPARRAAVLAAEIFLVMAAAAAAMVVPASPLHRLLWPSTRAVPVVPPPVAAEGGAAPPTGIALPAPAALVVVLRDRQDSGTVFIRLVPGDQVALRARGGNVAYTVTDGRIEIDNHLPAASYELDIPASLRHLRVTVAGRLLFQRDGERTESGQLLPDGRYRVALADPTGGH